jgi:hypothetical protein
MEMFFFVIHIFMQYYHHLLMLNMNYNLILNHLISINVMLELIFIFVGNYLMIFYLILKNCLIEICLMNTLGMIIIF